MHNWHSAIGPLCIHIEGRRYIQSTFCVTESFIVSRNPALPRCLCRVRVVVELAREFFLADLGFGALAHFDHGKRCLVNFASRIRALEQRMRVGEVCKSCFGNGGGSIYIIEGDEPVPIEPCKRCGKVGPPMQVIQIAPRDHFDQPEGSPL